MNFRGRLEAAVDKSDSLLAVGLDPLKSKIPSHLKGPDAIYNFNRAIIDATSELVCAYKPNTAFYEAFGASGIEQLKRTCDYIKLSGVPLIVDAKRADIGDTNEAYAAFVFDYLNADAVTLNPYLGNEALKPFLKLKNKGMIILCRTSNPGASELQDLVLDNGQKMYEAVALNVVEKWNKNNNCLLVVGATYPAELAHIRKIVGDDITFLVPGIGAQGGNVQATVEAGINNRGKGMIINSGRSIIYAGHGKDFAKAAAEAAQSLRDEINRHRS